jgi:hypothetical protein
MGIGSFFRRVRGDKQAMPDPDSPEFQAAVQGSAPEPGTNGPGAPEPSTPAPGMPGTTVPGIEGGETSFFGTGGQPTAVTPESLVAAGVPPEHAQQAAAAMAQVQQAFGGGAMQTGDVTVEHQGSHTLDLQGMEGMRDEMRDVMRQHGVDPDSGVAMDASSVAGLQQALLAVLARHGVDISQYWGR